MNFLGVSTAGEQSPYFFHSREERYLQVSVAQRRSTRAIVPELLHGSEADCVGDISPRDITSNSRRDYNSITHFAPRASFSETFSACSSILFVTLFIPSAQCLADDGEVSLTDVISRENG